jgi:NAD(P)-dependent dehydrogenase (short-subunit alcohol dehydrogenase family)
VGRLDGKVALISGGARGQGAVEAELFAREGAKVVFGDVLDAEGQNVEAAIRQAGHEATYIHLDVTQEADWQRAVQTAVSTYGTLDILVNNAGILRRENIEETTRELWDTVLAVNATGVFLGTKYAIPAMRAAGGGAIVNISSVSGMVALGAPAYNASKGAVRVFTKVTAVHHAKDNIRCNSIHPGPIDTPMTQTTDEERRGKIRDDVPLGRYGTSEDIAYGVLYLASDEAAYITGSELVIDGGYTAQ